jgi:hypothetical protein
MPLLHRPRKNSELPGNFDEAEALLSENAELRKTAAELLLQTAILREALPQNGAEAVYGLAEIRFRN